MFLPWGPSSNSAAGGEPGSEANLTWTTYLYLQCWFSFWGFDVWESLKDSLISICTEKQTSSGIHPNEPKPPRLPFLPSRHPNSLQEAWVKVKKNHETATVESWNPKSSNWRNKLSQLLLNSWKGSWILNPSSLIPVRPNQCLRLVHSLFVFGNAF